MKRLLLLQLLALPLLFASCDAPTAPEPQTEQVADPLFKPIDLPNFGTSTNCSWDTDRYYCGATSSNPFVAISWCPTVAQGTVLAQACLSKATGNWAFSSVCEDKQGRWKTVYKEALSADPLNCAVTTTFELGAADQIGFRFVYKGQGSGYANTTITQTPSAKPYDFDGALPPI